MVASAHYRTHRELSPSRGAEVEFSDKEVALAVLPISLPSLPSRSTFPLQSIIWNLAADATVGSALNSATQRLKEAEFDTAYLDAQVILAHVLGVDRPWLFAHGDAELAPQQAVAFTELIARRVDHEPVAYLVGHREFYGLDLTVDKRVLIPRPETEMLVDEVLSEIEARCANGATQVRVADIGTGSGAIALAIAVNEAAATIDAVDVSRKALAVARTNLQRHDARSQITLHHGNLLEPLTEPVDILVANLPYISRSEFVTLDPTVRSYEPRVALESGDEGLDAIARLLRQANSHLAERATIYLEIGRDQALAVFRLAQNVLPRMRDIAVHQDYQGHDRMVVIVL